MVVPLLVLAIGLAATGVGAFLALFRSTEPTTTLSLIGAGGFLAVVGVLLSLTSSHDGGASLGVGAIASIVVIVAAAGYAARVAWRAQRDGGPSATGPSTAGPSTDD